MEQKKETHLESQEKPPHYLVEDTEIHDVLLKIGIPPNLLGYTYLLYATELILSDPEYMQSITKRLYVDVAKKFKSTPSRVERNIRNAIRTGWLYGNINYINHMFRYCIAPEKESPSNSLFLSRLYYYFHKSA
ncbi:MAG: sporulation initiation factor Spo0A C-terminal domain-containing protein [Butyrivibrio sp.]